MCSQNAATGSKTANERTNHQSGRGIEQKPVVRPVGCWAAWEGGAGSVPGTACMAGLDPLLAQAL